MRAVHSAASATPQRAAQAAHVQLRWVLRALGFALAIGFGAYAYYEFEPVIRGYVSERVAVKILPTPSITEPAALAALPWAKPPGLDASNSPEPVPFILTSVSPGRNAREGVAGLGTSLDSAQLFAAGALLPNGSRLAEVHSDHAVLEQKAGRVALYLDGRPAQVLSSDARLSTRQTIEQQVLHVGGARNRSKEITPEPGYSLASVVRTQPVFDNGQLRGLLVMAGENARLFDALGFKSGDLVIAVDGARIESAAQGEDLFGALESGGPVAVALEREGHLEYLHIDAEAARKASHAAPDLSMPPAG